MSICHLKLIKLNESVNIVTYEIESFDFNPDHKWEKFGLIEINKINATYIHKNDELWEKYKIFPITALEVPLEKRKELKDTKFKGYSSARWTIHVFNFIMKCLETGEYPEKKELIS